MKTKHGSIILELRILKKKYWFTISTCSCRLIKMVGEEGYDYLAPLPFIEPFDRIGVGPFITKMKALIGKLW